MSTPTKEEIQKLTDEHTAAQEARRSIEKEIADVETGIRTAIGLGRADDVLALSKRRRELPALLVEKSAVEAAHAVALYKAQHERTYELACEAQDRLDEVEVAFRTRKAEVEKELAVMEAGVTAARQKLGAIMNEHETWAQHYTRASQGYLGALQEAARTL